MIMIMIMMTMSLTLMVRLLLLSLSFPLSLSFFPPPPFPSFLHLLSLTPCGPDIVIFAALSTLARDFPEACVTCIKSSANSRPFT